MRRSGLAGVVLAGSCAPRSPIRPQPALTNRVKTVSSRLPRPNALWVSDFTDVATWSGFVDVAFVIDVFARRIPRVRLRRPEDSSGRRASRSAQASFVLDALEQALHERRPVQGSGLVHHSDRGSPYLALALPGHFKVRG